MLAYKVIKILDSIETAVVRLCLILLMLIGIYALYDAYYIYYNAQSNRLSAFKPGSENTAMASDRQIIVEDMAAWLTIDETSIDYPVMQGDTNFDYLNTDPYGDYSFSGSIFLDSRNNRDFEDPYSLIYGHHMDQGGMFGALDRFADEDYFKSHTKGTLIINNVSVPIRLFAYADVHSSDKEVFNPTDGHDIASFIKEHASIYTEYTGGKIVCLSTCADASTTARTTVFAEIL